MQRMNDEWSTRHFGCEAAKKPCLRGVRMDDVIAPTLDDLAAIDVQLINPFSKAQPAGN
jgi:hypothetical protein